MERVIKCLDVENTLCEDTISIIQSYIDDIEAHERRILMNIGILTHYFRKVRDMLYRSVTASVRIADNERRMYIHPRTLPSLCAIQYQVLKLIWYRNNQFEIMGQTRNYIISVYDHESEISPEKKRQISYAIERMFVNL